MAKPFPAVRKRRSFMIDDILNKIESKQAAPPGEKTTQLPVRPTKWPAGPPRGATGFNGVPGSLGAAGCCPPAPILRGLPHGLIGQYFCPPPPPSGLFGFAGDCSLSVPIPLPVYVRTRSPGGSELLKPKKCRRSRTVFTELQLMGLEKKFDQQKYLSTSDRIELAETLGLSQIQVKTWYQNRRMKWKKQVLQGGGTEPPTKPKGRPKKNSTLSDSCTSSPDNKSSRSACAS